jgi:hypothetical protein
LKNKLESIPELNQSELKNKLAWEPLLKNKLSFVPLLKNNELNQRSALVLLLNQRELKNKLGSVWLLKNRLLNHKLLVAWEPASRPCPTPDPTRALKSSEEAVNPLFETLSRCGLLLANAMPVILNAKTAMRAIAVTVFMFRS